MKTFWRYILCGVFALAFNNIAVAGDKGTAEEATTLVKKAIEYIKANGEEKAYIEFNNRRGQFVDRDLYIFVQDMKGKMLAHGGNSRLVGKDLIDLKDADGKFFVKAMIEAANTKGKGWIDYKWQNPSTQVIEPKSSYVEKYKDVFVGCGIYK